MALHFKTRSQLVSSLWDYTGCIEDFQGMFWQYLGSARKSMSLSFSLVPLVFLSALFPASLSFAWYISVYFYSPAP